MGSAWTVEGCTEKHNLVVWSGAWRLQSVGDVFFCMGGWSIVIGSFVVQDELDHGVVLLVDLVVVLNRIVIRVSVTTMMGTRGRIVVSFPRAKQPPQQVPDDVPVVVELPT